MRTTAGAIAFTRMPCDASSIPRCCVSECRPALAIEYADDGVAEMAWCAHMEPRVTTAPPRPCATMPETTVWVTKKVARLRSRYAS